MTTRTVEQIEEWERASFAGGYEGLRDLASREFSGVVVAGPARLFMLGGTVVGVLDGDVEDFEDADGTARSAPHEALPLLAVMQERSTRVRAKYYTEDTPLYEVDRTLSDGNFTGYVELSENVLSGDYYAVYHQGRSMSVAWIGSAGRFAAGDEAFEAADDEVGIYEVRPAEIEVIEIPEPEPDPDPGTAAADTDAPSADRDAATRSEGDATTGAERGDGPSTADRREPAPAGEDTPPGADDDGETVVDADGEREPERPAEDRRRTAGRRRTSEDDAPRGTAAPGDGRAADDEADDVRTDDERTENGSSGRNGAEGVPGSHPVRTDAPADRPDREEPTDGTDRGHETAVSRPADAGDGDTVDAPSTAESAEARGGAAEEAGVRESPPRSSDTEPRRERPAGGPQDNGNHGTDGVTVERADTDSPAEDRPDGTVAGGSTDGETGAPSEEPVSPDDLETRSLPSLDPSRTESAGRVDTVPEPDEGTTEPESAGGPETGGWSGGRIAEERTRETVEPAGAGGVEELSARLREREAEIERLETRLSETSAERDELAAERRELVAERDDLAAERDELAAEREELAEEREELITERDRLAEELEEARSEVERLRERLEAETPDGDGVDLTPTRAIDETNLFVRYRSKSDPTLEDAHAGESDAAAVAENLRLEYHTGFEAEGATVDGRPFDEFLEETVQYRFARWLVGELLYEIRDSGAAGGMEGLYDALPGIDRIELNGRVGVVETEDGRDNRTQTEFDVVIRDRMGNSLAVATINDSRDPATESMMNELIRGAEAVGETSESLAGAFLVTESFFEPGALETTEEATSGGLLSRDRRKSFVNLTRKTGYHLCLVEARNGEFHLAVPEL